MDNFMCVYCGDTVLADSTELRVVTVTAPETTLLQQLYAHWSCVVATLHSMVPLGEVLEGLADVDRDGPEG